MRYLVLFAVLLGAARADQTINVTGDAQIKVPPDQVILALGVEVHSKTLDVARQENDARVRRVRASAARMGIRDQDVQTDFIQLGMEYENDGITPRYYYTRKSVVFTLRDVDRMEAVLSAAVDAGATHIHRVQFETTRLREYRDQARALAVKAAMEKARDMAAAAGMKVTATTGISAASYGGLSSYAGWWGSGGYGQMAQNVVQQMGADSGNGQGTIALGRISVTASVSMSFRIE